MYFKAFAGLFLFMFDATKYRKHKVISALSMMRVYRDCWLEIYATALCHCAVFFGKNKKKYIFSIKHLYAIHDTKWLVQVIRIRAPEILFAVSLLYHVRREIDRDRAIYLA